MKKRIVIWGAGKMLPLVFDSININIAEVIGIIDQRAESINSGFRGCKIFKPDRLSNLIYDYIVISVKNIWTVEDIIRIHGGNKIVRFWQDDLSEYDFLSENLREIVFLKEENTVLRARIENYPYEAGLRQQIRMISSEILLLDMLIKRNSLVRFGDGEFELMRMKKRPYFQEPNEILAQRLREIIQSNEDNIYVAIADNFGNLEKYTERAADAIRVYLYHNRNNIYELLDLDREYYDAYVSRPYLIYKDKNHAKRIFFLFKELIKGRSILMVEGKFTRTGYRNDLFDNSKSIRRVLCPDKNAFDIYEKILCSVKEVAKIDDIILISLGPAATIMAYDLARIGYQAIDCGQIDNEYEWFLRGCEIQENIPYKTTSEAGQIPVEDEIDEMFKSQVVAEVYE